MLKGFWNGCKYLWYARKPVPCDGAGIDAYSDLSPIEQRVKRLEEGRTKDWEFYTDVLDNLKERVEKLEDRPYYGGPIA
jgi:hypothetical protein